MKRFLHIILFLMIVYAVIVSTILLCIAFPRILTQNYGFDYIGVIIGILSFLVTLLIGWQIANYFMSKDTIQKMIDDKVADLASDYIYVLEVGKRSEEHINHVIIDCNEPIIIDDCISAVEMTEKFKNNRLKDYAIDNSLQTLQNILNQHGDEKSYKILKGKREQYCYILKDVKHRYKDSLLQLINNAEET